jgi:hypothetical protein
MTNALAYFCTQITAVKSITVQAPRHDNKYQGEGSSGSDTSINKQENYYKTFFRRNLQS